MLTGNSSSNCLHAIQNEANVAGNAVVVLIFYFFVARLNRQLQDETDVIRIDIEQANM